MARNLRTRTAPGRAKQNIPPLFSMDCLNQPSEDAFYRVNESLIKENGISTFLASVLFKNKDTDKIKKHVKEIAKGFSDEKFKSLLRKQPHLSYSRMQDDIAPMLKVLDIPQEHAKIFLMDIKKSRFEIPEDINASHLVGIHDSRKNVTRILRFYDSRTVELKMLSDLKKDGFTLIE